jgi:tetratricopeptide (TPR) repeat protein
MTMRTIKTREGVLALLAFGALAGAVAVLAVARLRPIPSLDGVEPLLAASRFDDVERRVGAYLRVHPESTQANMLMAQVALARDDQKPSLALEHLRRIRSSDRSIQAIVQLNQGKAYSALARYDLAEAAWKEALRLDPRVPEAGWALLGLYYVQSRRDEAHQLGLALHAVEPDPRDRAQLLLELLRQDAQTLVFETVAPVLEPAVRDHPEDLHTAIALGLALVRSSRIDQGLSILRQSVQRHGDNRDAWDAWLRGLDEGRQLDKLDEELARLPTAIAGDPRFERYRGAVAMERRDWSRAADAYLRAWRSDSSDLQVLYRLYRMLRTAGRHQEAEAFGFKARQAIAARDQALELYRQANAETTLGVALHAQLYQRLADLREGMGRSDEALAWHRLVLRDQPDDPISRKAVARLQAAIVEGTVSRR